MNNPTDAIDISFKSYVAERTMKEAKHLDKGIPDYAFSSDYALRQKIRNIPGIYPLFKAANATIVPQVRQQINTSGMRVTGKQYPRMYEILGHCAETLGIGMPTLFVSPLPFDKAGWSINACTYPTDDSDPIVVITPAAVERLSEKELFYMLGHECGHIHNNHGIYDTIVKTVLSVAEGTILARLRGLLTLPIKAALNTWSRAAEVTSDRAGIICGGDIDGFSAQMVKLMNQGTFGAEYDIDEILKQYDEMGSVAQITELLYADHPYAVRRILAGREFVKSEVYYSWHPEKRKQGERPYTKQELDIRCNKFLSTVNSEKEVG